MFQDEDFMAFSLNGVWVATSAIARFWEIQKHGQQYGYAKMAILLKESNQIIGYCGFEQWFWKMYFEWSGNSWIGISLVQAWKTKGLY